MDWNRAYQYRLDWFTSFVAVAESGGFSAAALNLYRSQPRISMHVAELERAVGMKLFDRSVHPVALTPEGRVLLEQARTLLECVTSIGDLVTGTEVHGEVRLGVYPSAATFLFPVVVDWLRSSHPNVTLLLWEGPTLALDEALLDGSIDLAVRAVVPQPDSVRLAHRSLWREDLVAVLPADDPRATLVGADIASLTDDRLVITGDAFGRGGSHFEANLAIKKAGIDPEIAHQTSQPQTLVALVRRGLGIGITNALAMRVSNLEGVALVPIDDRELQREVALWWRQDTGSSPARRVVQDAIVDAAVAAIDELGDDHVVLTAPLR